MNEYVIVTFLLDPAQGEVSRRTAYIRNNGLLDDVPSFTPLSNRCVHLGCPVQANGLPLDDDKQEERTGENVITRIPTAATAGFGCPCHGGQYDNEGNRTAGPPVRALDRYEFRIDNGRLLLGKTYSVSEVDGTGAEAQIHAYELSRPRTARRRPRGVVLPGAAAPLMATKKKPGLLHKLLHILLYPLTWLEERTSLPGRSGLVGGIKYFLFRKVPHDISGGTRSARQRSPRSSSRPSPA